MANGIVNKDLIIEDITSNFTVTQGTNSDVSISSAYKYGKVVQLNLAAKTAATLSVGGTFTATIVSADPSLLPKHYAKGIYVREASGTLGAVHLNSAGTLTGMLATGTQASTHQPSCSLVYICK